MQKSVYPNSWQSIRQLLPVQWRWFLAGGIVGGMAGGRGVGRGWTEKREPAKVLSLINTNRLRRLLNKQTWTGTFRLVFYELSFGDILSCKHRQEHIRICTVCRWRLSISVISLYLGISEKSFISLCVSMTVTKCLIKFRRHFVRAFLAAKLRSSSANGESR